MKCCVICVVDSLNITSCTKWQSMSIDAQHSSPVGGGKALTAYKLKRSLHNTEDGKGLWFIYTQIFDHLILGRLLW